MIKITKLKNGRMPGALEELAKTSLTSLIFSFRVYKWEIALKCHNVTIMKNAQGDRVIIQEVK